jgi:hypothetical protein
MHKGGKFGFLNTKGEEAIPFQYDFAFDFAEGIAFVGNIPAGERVVMEYTCIDTHGKSLLPQDYEAYYPPQNGQILAQKKSTSFPEEENALFDIHGNLLRELSLPTRDSLGNYREYLFDKKTDTSNLFDVVDKDGKVILKVDDNYISYCGQGIYYIQKEKDKVDGSYWVDLSDNKKYSFETIQEQLYRRVTDSQSNWQNILQSVQKEEEKTAILKEAIKDPNLAQNGTSVIIEPSIQYSDASFSFYFVTNQGGKNVVKEGGIKIGSEGKITIKIGRLFFWDYNGIQLYIDDYMGKGNSTYWFVDSNGNVIKQTVENTDPEYHFSLWAVCDNGKWGYLNTKGNYAITPRFKWADAFHAVDGSEDAPFNYGD